MPSTTPVTTSSQPPGNGRHQASSVAKMPTPTKMYWMLRSIPGPSKEAGGPCAIASDAKIRLAAKANNRAVIRTMK